MEVGPNLIRFFLCEITQKTTGSESNQTRQINGIILKMVTIKDVALKTGVSVATASRALHGNGYVSKKTKAKVLKAAKELGYIVNVNASSLKDTSRKNVGIILSSIANPYFINVVKDLQLRLRENGIGLILAISDNDKEDEARQIKYLIGNHVSAILFIPSTSRNEEALDLAAKNGVKVIQLFINVYKRFHSIVNDDEGGVYLAGKHLVQQGHKRLMLFDVKYDPFFFGTVNPKRENGLIRLRKEFSGIETKAVQFDPLAIDDRGYAKEIEAYNPDAIIAGTGNFGLSVLRYLKASSRRIPVVSFDDNDWFEYLGISAIRQSEEQLMEKIIGLATGKRKGKIQHIKIEETLVLRDRYYYQPNND